MTQIELFAGIGGFGLAGHWAGIQTVCQVEIDSFCQKVLAKNFPHAHRHDDIHTFDGRPYAGTIDVVSGGFPCQPYSAAGKRLGKEDERHLWPEMLRVIREARPRWVVGENVGGLISWSAGLVFEEVCADLETIGYEVQPFVLPACAVDAPHRRDRVWFVAYAERVRQQGQGRPLDALRAKENGKWETNMPFHDFRRTSEPPICGMDDGIPARLDKHRNKRLKALGNAIVPQVAYQIFKAIVEYEHLHRS